MMSNNKPNRQSPIANRKAKRGFTPTPKFGVSSAKAKRGFTIVEAVVAVGVFAMASTSIVGVYLSVQRLNRVSAGLQAVQLNGRFIMEDIAKIVRNGSVNYDRYPSRTAPSGSGTNLYLRDVDGTPVEITWAAGSPNLNLRRASSATTYNSPEVRVLNFRVYIHPRQDPFRAGASVREQPTVTVWLHLESTVSSRDVARQYFQTTAATRLYQ